MLTGLLYAMKGEIESLLPEGAEPEKTVAGVPFYRIRENVVACCGGVGKVNAAMATQLFIDLYAPGRIVNVGVAGCFENVPIGTLVLADRFMQHDVDTSGIGDPVGAGVHGEPDRLPHRRAGEGEGRHGQGRVRLSGGQRRHRRVVRHGVRQGAVDRRDVPPPAH